MADRQSMYIFPVLFTPPGEPTITLTLNAPVVLLLLDANRRADRHMGRPTTPREIRLRNLVQARDQLRQRGDVTQEALAEEIGVGVRTIRRWITDFKMNWSQFLDI
jgi:hypothetical protein